MKTKINKTKMGILNDPTWKKKPTPFKKKSTTKELIKEAKKQYDAVNDLDAKYL